MAHNVSTKRAATNVFVRMVCLVIHTKRVVLRTNLANHTNVAAIKIALTHWPAFKGLALARAKACCADKMHIVNRKIMLLGADVASALLKMNMANVFHVRYYVLP